MGVAEWIGLAALLISVLLPLLRSVGGHWSRLSAENGKLKEEAVHRTEQLYDVQIEKMLIETKLEICQSELENWKSGRWRRTE